MTLEEVKTSYVQQHHQIMYRNKAKGTWIVEILTRAQKEGRLVSGMYRAIKSLEKNARNIVVCILPQNHLNDAGIRVISILLEAFCNENHVPVLKVDSEEKLARIFRGDNLNEIGVESIGGGGDFGCILLLQASSDKSPSKSEKHLLQMHAETDYTFVLELPVP